MYVSLVLLTVLAELLASPSKSLDLIHKVYPCDMKNAKD